MAETIYAPPYSPDDIISLVQWLPEDLLDKVRPEERFNLLTLITRILAVDAIADWKSAKYLYVYESPCREHAAKGSGQFTSGDCKTFDW